MVRGVLAAAVAYYDSGAYLTNPLPNPFYRLQ
jgi:hypothetical protein